MTSRSDNEDFEIMKVGKSALHIIHENHGEEGYKYALYIFKEIEANDLEINQRKEQNDRWYGILQQLVMTSSSDKK
jgi:hypothetical protein